MCTQEYIELRTGTSQLMQLQQRAGLVHWSLFVFFNHPQVRVCVCV